LQIAAATTLTRSQEGILRLIMIKAKDNEENKKGLKA
jgi:hypothetical protein